MHTCRSRQISKTEKKKGEMKQLGSVRGWKAVRPHPLLRHSWNCLSTALKPSLSEIINQHFRFSSTDIFAPRVYSTERENLTAVIWNQGHLHKYLQLLLNLTTVFFFLRYAYILIVSIFEATFHFHCSTFTETKLLLTPPSFSQTCYYKFEVMVIK